MGSSNHLITKKLKPSHIQHALDIPIDVLRAFPILESAHDMWFVAFDSDDKPWLFLAATRQVGDHPKPVIRKSTWHPFVLAKDLQVGDEVGFDQETDEATGQVTRYRVRARQRVNLFGNHDAWINV